MSVELNKVVSLHYRLFDVDGNLLEDSRVEDQPILYLHGSNGMLPTLAKEMEGKQVGDVVKATLTPEQAYGQREEGRVQRVSKKYLLSKGALKPGMLVQLSTKEGPLDAFLLKVSLKTVDIDTNHPYAGLTLTFEVEILDIRDATEEEIAHGHAHGAGGHQH